MAVWAASVQLESLRRLHGCYHEVKFKMKFLRRLRPCLRPFPSDALQRGWYSHPATTLVAREDTVIAFRQPDIDNVNVDRVIQNMVANLVHAEWWPPLLLRIAFRADTLDLEG